MPDNSDDSRDQQIVRLNAALQILSGKELRDLVADLENGVARNDRAYFAIAKAKALRPANDLTDPIPE